MIDEKILNKIRALKAQSISEFNIGNEGASVLFENKYKELLNKYNLSENDIEIKSEAKIVFENKLGKTVIQNPFIRVNSRKIERLFWYDELAKVIASGYACKANPVIDTNEITFYGYDNQRELAIFMFDVLSNIANIEAENAIKGAKESVGQFDMKTKKVLISEWLGDSEFLASFHAGFRDSINENYKFHVFDSKLINEVNDYFNKNRSSDDDNGNNYYYSEVEIKPTWDYAFELGKKVGYVTLKKSNKPNSNLVSKSKALSRNVITNNDSVYLLIDCSDSMSGYKLEQAKQGALEFAKNATENQNTAVGLIRFDTNVEHLIKPQTKIDKKFESKINNLGTTGYTNMLEAIKAAQLYFTNRRKKRTLVIVTDGIPTTKYGSPNPEQTLVVANEAKRDGIKIIAIGVDGAKEDFIKKLSSEEGLGILTSKEMLRLTMGEMAANL
jgi:Mg-chelatase subunit ChlD